MKRITVTLEINDNELSHLDEDEKMEYIENMIYVGIEDYNADIRVGFVDIDE